MIIATPIVVMISQYKSKFGDILEKLMLSLYGFPHIAVVVSILFISVKIFPSKKLKSTNLVTSPYPGFPTDLQAQMMALMSVVDGTSQIRETVFENRFMHVPELKRMGENIEIKNKLSLIHI